MISENETFQGVCKDIVRGAAPITQLEPFGLTVVCAETGLSTANPIPFDLEFRPSLVDLCTGIFYYANQPRRTAQRWGFLMHVILVVDHLGETEDDPTIEGLQDALWDFMFLNPLDERTIEYARLVSELLPE